MDIFCKIIKNEIPSYTIYEDNIVKVFLDINPNQPGHTLIIPKKHYLNINDIDIDTLNHIMKISKNIYSLIDDKLHPDGITLLQNNGITQDIKHFHLHLIPKYKVESPMTVEEIYNKLKIN